LALILFAALWGHFGCATQEVWEGAKRDERSYEGVVRAVDDATGNARLIVRYGGWAISEAFVSIPLDSTGAPPAKLTYVGKARVSREINAGLSPVQSDTVARFALAPAPSREAGSADDSDRMFCYLSGFRVVAVALSRDGTPLTGGPHGVSNDAVQFPNDCRILLLPAEIPRSIEERRASAVTATLLTPATVPIDAALIPVGFVYRFLTGD
jgi:hypothetical protein